jgi:hypothetical protein
MMKKKPMAPKPRATKRGTPVPMPKMPSKGPMARMTDQAKPKAVKKIITPKPKITRKPVTERQLLDVKNMTPAEKMAYIKRGKRGF